MMTITLTYTVEVPEDKIYNVVDDIVEYIQRCIDNNWYYPHTIFDNFKCYIVTWDIGDNNDEEISFFIRNDKSFAEEIWKIFRDYMKQKMEENGIEMKVGEDLFEEYIEKNFGRGE